jgi:hypothetical protein
MIINFREYLSRLEEYALSNDYAGAAHDTTSGTTPYQSPDIWTTNSNKGEVPQHNIGLPMVTRRGKVVRLEYKSGGNVEVHLEDRTVIKLTHGDLKRVGGDPMLPPDPVTHQPRSTLTIAFQRSPSDTGQVVSQITKASCENVPQVRMQQVNGVVSPPVQNTASGIP